MEFSVLILKKKEKTTNHHYHAILVWKNELYNERNAARIPKWLCSNIRKLKGAKSVTSLN